MDAAFLDPENNPLTTPILDRQSVLLHHISTNKKLHSHDVRAPVTEVEYQNEISAYGFEGFSGDANDHFTIEIDKLVTDSSGGKIAKERLQTLRTKFRLRHTMTGCYLFSHKVNLPEWGFEQQEVTCNKQPSKENGLWYIETNTHGGRTSSSLSPSQTLTIVLACSTRERTSGQLPSPGLLLQVYRAPDRYVDDERWIDGATRLRLSTFVLAHAQAWYQLVSPHPAFPPSLDSNPVSIPQLGQGSPSDLPHRQPLRLVPLDPVRLRLRHRSRSPHLPCSTRSPRLWTL